jgi:predicted nucleotidyltransferase
VLTLTSSQLLADAIEEVPGSSSRWSCRMPTATFRLWRVDVAPSEVASLRILRNPSSLQRDLKALVDGGILEARWEGTRAYFKADARSPVFPELRGLIDKTADVVPTLREVLRPLDRRIACAFVYGSVARNEEHAASDIDVMVIGDVGLAEITPALRKAEVRFGREVNATSYSTAEFRKKSAAKDHFLSQVLRGQKLFVMGDQRDVDDLVGRPRRSTASDIEARTR